MKPVFIYGTCGQYVNRLSAIRLDGTEQFLVQSFVQSSRPVLYRITLPVRVVQWHPERQSYALRRDDAVDAAPLFDYFLSQVR